MIKPYVTEYRWSTEVIAHILNWNARHSVVPEKGRQLACPPGCHVDNSPWQLQSHQARNECWLFSFPLKTKARCWWWFCCERSKRRRGDQTKKSPDSAKNYFQLWFIFRRPQLGDFNYIILILIVLCPPHLSLISKHFTACWQRTVWLWQKKSWIKVITTCNTLVNTFFVMCRAAPWLSYIAAEWRGHSGRFTLLLIHCSQQTHKCVL